MKLNNIKIIKGKIRLLSGLHIGTGDTEMHIGGTDTPVMKHPHTYEPYIPGSSLKGKIRSLLELKSGLIVKDGKPISVKMLKACTDNNEKRVACENILKIFGISGADSSEENANIIGLTRASFSDAYFSENCKKRIKDERLPRTEIKSENTIDRITGTAGDPRTTERVPSGMEFEFRVSLKEFDADKNLITTLLEGFKLLEMDALGGSGSRGYGRVKIEFEDDELKTKFEEINLFSNGAEL